MNTVDSGNPSPDGASQASEASTAAEDQNLLDAVFGDSQAPSTGLVVPSALKTTFAPWHHPTKQIVRDYQWADLTLKLVESRPAAQQKTLKYFTLPGADLLDVRVLANALRKIGTRIEYFGFDSGYRKNSPEAKADDDKEKGIYFATESALRQAGQITDSAEILGDHLEDIAQTGTQAANRLNQQSVFDVINIDACDHLGFVPNGRQNSIFDALDSLLAHQLRATSPWLLFITTRVNPALFGTPTLKLNKAILDNLALHQLEFGAALAECIEGTLQTISTDLSACWSNQDVKLLKLFAVGLGKYLLHFFHGQHNLPADVELVSAMAYKVHSEQPDMLSLAFRITPTGPIVQPATAGPVSTRSELEVAKAIRVAAKAKKLWDIDIAIASDSKVRLEAVQGITTLLRSAHYDLPSWASWLSGLPLRPMNIDDLSDLLAQ